MIFEKRTERREERAEKLSEEDNTIPGTHEDISVFPMAIPMLAGPGSIATMMLLMSDPQNTGLLSKAVILGSAGINLLLCLVIFLAIGPIMRFIGDSIAAMITRILGVILAALAAQFIFDGIRGGLLEGGAHMAVSALS